MCIHDSSDPKAKAKAILNELRAPLPNNQNVFVIRAKGDAPVALYAQQARALNLVWALAINNGDTLKEKDVVVVGAGAAGLTAAAAAGLAGAKSVVVLEKAAQAMGLQLGCHHRFLHPRYFDWPHQKSYMASAHLPILNWSVGTADAVANQILDNFNRICDLLLDKKPEVEKRVSHIELTPDNECVKYQKDEEPDKRRDQPGGAEQSDGGKKRLVRRKPCNVLIFAVVEQTVSGLPLRSYWRVDPLDQGYLTPPDRNHRVLIADDGDGGMIDVLRARLEGFDHGPFADRFLDLTWDNELRCAIRKAEDKAKKHREEVRSLSGVPAKADLDDLAKNETARLLQEEYEQIWDGYCRNSIGRVWAMLTRMLRKGVEVTWLA